MSKNHLAAFALASAFGLIAALPAAAAPTKPAGAQPQVTTSHQHGAVRGSGHLQVHRERAPKTPDFFAASAQECSFTCGDWLVTCSGSTASCTDSSCEATGGGYILTAECIY